MTVKTLNTLGCRPNNWTALNADLSNYKYFTKFSFSSAFPFAPFPRAALLMISVYQPWKPGKTERLSVKPPGREATEFVSLELVKTLDRRSYTIKSLGLGKLPGHWIQYKQMSVEGQWESRWLWYCRFGFFDFVFEPNMRQSNNLYYSCFIQYSV